MKKKLVLSVFVLSAFITGCQRENFAINSVISKSNEEAVMKAYSVFTDKDDEDKYYDIEEYIDDNGQVASDCSFVLLDIKIENIDAVGIEKKNEFNISSMCLYTPTPITKYMVAYFSDGFDDAATAYHFTIENGETKNTQLVFIVLDKDLDKLTGGLDVGNNQVLKFQLN